MGSQAIFHVSERSAGIPACASAFRRRPSSMISSDVDEIEPSKQDLEEAGAGSNLETLRF